MKNLLLMRHASAAEKAPGQYDHDRVLTLYGERQAGEAGLWLRSQNLLPELVLCSSAVRTQMTVASLLQSMDLQVPVHLERQLYDESEEEYRHLIQEVEDEVETLLVVAHNPCVSALASQLTHGSLSMEQGSILCLHYPGFSWEGLRPGSCKLHLSYGG